MSVPTRYRIAVVAACPFPSLRGSQVLVRETAEQLAQAGHTVHVVTYPTAQHLTPVARIAIHRVAKLPGLWTARPFGWQKVILDVLLAWVLWRVVRQQRIDVIHAHNLEAPLIAFLVRWLTGVPVVYHAHNALADELPCYVGQALRRLARAVGAGLDRRLAGAADHTIALSDRLAAYLAVRGGAGRVSAIAPAAARLAVAEAAARRERAPVIMYGGNLDPYQNLDCLLHGFARLRAVEPQARLVLVTHATAHPKTEARAARLAGQPGVAVQVVNSFAAAMRALSGADVLVCPRASWSGFPIKVLNYMVLGRPIVHARASAHALEDGVTGVLYDDGDAGALAKALLRVVRDPALAAQLGRQARSVARERFATARALTRLAAVYEHVIDGARRGGQMRPRRPAREVEYAMVEHGNPMQQRPSPRRRRSGQQRLTLLVATLALATLIGCAARRSEAPLPPLAEPLSPSLVDTGQYKLEPGDVLRVKFTYQPEMDVKVQIDPDGNIAIPGVGELQARGKTAEELATDIETLSSTNLRDPEVTVIVAELGPRKVYVGGEVRLPGPVPYRVGMTPMQAIMDRGGFTEVARIDSVLHVTSKGNSVEASRLDFSDELKNGSPELSSLAVNDVIYVPRTFIGDANAFVRLYIRGLMPTMPRMGVGFTP
jgi:protein involved in polysaccharide export with SLBB domain/glycosyltransferase involved in cell wall biosynthesis